MAAASTASRRSAPRRAPAESWWLRVRWDRVGRVALLVVLAGLVLLYIGPARNYLSTWRQSRTARATVTSLEHEHRALTAEHKSLLDPRTLERRARALGMVRPDERSYVIVGLPKR
jgi:hypothetical protein